MKIQLLQTVARADFTAQAESIIDVDDELGLSLTKAGSAQWLNPKPANIGLHATRAANTIKAYHSDWEHFKNWCQDRGIVYLEPSPKAVASYLEYCSKKFSFSTIKRRLSAIIIFYREQGQEIDRYNLTIRQTMEYIRRKLAGHSLRRPHALLIEDIRAICSSLPKTIKSVRDRAIILIGFAAGLRGSEIVSLDWNEVKLGSDGKGSLRFKGQEAEIALKSSKTDQRGYGRTIVLKEGKSPETCPIDALQKWRQICGGAQSGAVFKRLTPQGKITEQRLSRGAVSELVKQAVGSVGLISEHYSSHSLRAGHVTQAAMNGASEREIMRTTGHRSTSTLHRYMREAQMRSLSTSANHLGL